MPLPATMGTPLVGGEPLRLFQGALTLPTPLVAPDTTVRFLRVENATPRWMRVRGGTRRTRKDPGVGPPSLDLPLKFSVGLGATRTDRTFVVGSNLHSGE